MLHDTHVHLEMLLQKLGLVADLRTLSRSQLSQYSLDQKARNTLTELLVNHELVLHSTVSTDNFALVSHLFGFLPKVHYFLGSHPDIVDADFDLDTYLASQKQFLSQNKVPLVGIGEVGLDYNHTKNPDFISTQKLLFRSQIKIAIDLDLPLMIHCREAFDDLYAIIREYPAIHGRFLIHCFTGNVDNLQKCLELGGKVAFGGIVTYDSAIDLQKSCELCPLDRYVLETDTPFLSPTPHRGQVCLPEYIDNVAQKIAQIKSISKSEVWNNSRQNVRNLLSI